ncbi:LytR family transcriptional regulator [Virgibacillus dakarensis]|uniref:Transcriptional regulator YvhJ n=1 Tax=Lentibacillus populi TaxID=1827502 RepID=A0A9W5X7W2_9BACI|nr:MULTISPECIES: LCP family protein [Bacillaceae]MBT2217713.1 LCP family protein [Virgibacillus dakarensis]MTW88187.1 LytR family transcriptional regulator [Virgibacillus dakarensis]GGB59675.1 putative transcriptional regulator YvhJ [Lentibacillus populi]
MSELRTERRRQRKKTKRWKKRILLILLILFIIIVGGLGYLFFHAYNAAKNSYQDLDRPGEKSALRDMDVTIGKDPISILLMGVETYATGGENGRADTQIVVTLNPHTNTMTMTTIPRDTQVDLPAEGAGQYAGIHKINAAYTYGSITGYGGNKFTVETVEQLLNIPIDEYVAVDFEGFRDIVDALGGVTVNIKEGFWEKNIYNDNKKIYFKKGPAKLNGEEALAFVRMRKRAVNNVYSRDERQRQFIQAAINEAVSVGTIFKLGEISDILGKDVETSLTPTEIYALQKVYSSIDASAIKTYTIEGSDQTTNGGSYFIPTDEGLAEVSRKLKQELELQE